MKSKILNEYIHNFLGAFPGSLPPILFNQEFTKRSFHRFKKNGWIEKDMGFYYITQKGFEENK